MPQKATDSPIDYITLRSRIVVCSLKKLLLELLVELFGVFFPGDSFAALVADGAAGLASGLASASAFATSGNFLFCGFSNSLNHSYSP